MTRPVVRLLDPADLETAWQALEQAFGSAAHPEDRDVELGVVDPSRWYAAYDGSRPVATAGSFALTMALPGGPRPVAGVSWVGVLPTYRRQGLMGEMMARQLTDLRAAGTAVAVLWASEGAIYQRYGYGRATSALELDLPRGAAFTRPVRADDLRLVDPVADRALLEQVHAAGQRAGDFARDDAWWRYRLHDPEHRRNGCGPLQAVVADGPDGVEGYALYATAAAWEGGVPSGTVRVRELVHTTPSAAARLWRHLLDLDLMTRVTAWPRPADDAVLHLLAEPRCAKPAVHDNLWVRLLDVGAALEQRALADDVDVVLDVADATCAWNAGRWHLSGGRSGATCRRTTDPAHLALDVADLGAVHLGGVALAGLAQAGRVVELRPGALAEAGRALAWHSPAACCPMVF